MFDTHAQSEIETVGICDYAHWIRKVAPGSCSVPNGEIFKALTIEKLLDMPAWMLFNYYASGPTAVFAGETRCAKTVYLGGDVESLEQALTFYVKANPTAALYGVSLIFHNSHQAPYFSFRARILL